MSWQIEHEDIIKVFPDIQSPKTFQSQIAFLRKLLAYMFYQKEGLIGNAKQGTREGMY